MIPYTSNHDAPTCSEGRLTRLQLAIYCDCGFGRLCSDQAIHPGSTAFQHRVCPERRQIATSSVGACSNLACSNITVESCAHPCRAYCCSYMLCRLQGCSDTPITASCSLFHGAHQQETQLSSFSLPAPPPSENPVKNYHVYMKIIRRLKAALSQHANLLLGAPVHTPRKS